MAPKHVAFAPANKWGQINGARPHLFSRLKKEYAIKILPKKFAQESELVQRANSAFEKKSFKNAATFYVESAFLYERAKETILRQRVLKEKRR